MTAWGLRSRCRTKRETGSPRGSAACGLGYDTGSLAFSVLYSVDAGNVIVIGHSGITGDTGTDWPSPGQIGAGDNLTFLMNCVAYLTGNLD